MVILTLLVKRRKEDYFWPGFSGPVVGADLFFLGVAMTIVTKVRQSRSNAEGRCCVGQGRRRWGAFKAKTLMEEVWRQEGSKQGGVCAWKKEGQKRRGWKLWS